MSKLDDSSGALSAAAVAKETLKDRVTQLDGKVDHLGGQVETMAERLDNLESLVTRLSDRGDLPSEGEPSSWGLNDPGGDVQSVTDRVKLRSLLWR